MKIVIQEDGSEVEMFTSEEIQSQKDAAIEEFKAMNPDKTAEIEDLQIQLTEANEKALKAGEKDFNFSALRAQKEALEKSIDEKVGVAKKEIFEGVMTDHYADTLKSLSSEDEELKKKIEFHYKRLADTAATKEQITKKLSDAYYLATAPEDRGVSPAAFSSGGASMVKPSKPGNFTEEEKATARKWAAAGGLNLEEKDFQ